MVLDWGHCQKLEPLSPPLFGPHVVPGHEVRSFLALEKSCLLSVCYRPPLLLAQWRADLGAALPGWQYTRPMALTSTTLTTGTVIRVKSPGRDSLLIGWRHTALSSARGSFGGPTVWTCRRCGSCRTSMRLQVLSGRVCFDLDHSRGFCLHRFRLRQKNKGEA